MLPSLRLLAILTATISSQALLPGSGHVYHVGLSWKCDEARVGVLQLARYRFLASKHKIYNRMDNTGNQLETVYLQRWATIGLPCSWGFYNNGVNMNAFARIESR